MQSTIIAHKMRPVPGNIVSTTPPSYSAQRWAVSAFARCIMVNFCGSCSILTVDDLTGLIITVPPSYGTANLLARFSPPNRLVHPDVPLFPFSSAVGVASTLSKLSNRKSPLSEAPAVATGEALEGLGLPAVDALYFFSSLSGLPSQALRSVARCMAWWTVGCSRSRLRGTVQHNTICKAQQVTKSYILGATTLS
jgi:hypothetical protein